jgi:hypothetical protein
MVGESFHHMVAGVRTVTIFRKGATAQKLLRLFAFECGLADPNRQISLELELSDLDTLKIQAICPLPDRRRIPLGIISV